MKRYEICYLVKEKDYPDYNCWETFSFADSLEDAYDQYSKMKNSGISLGESLESEKSYVEEWGIFDTMMCEFVEKEEIKDGKRLRNQLRHQEE